MSYIVVFITASSEKEAEKIAEGLIDSKAAACVNIIPRVKSIYTWQGKRETAEEVFLIAKTKQDNFSKLKQTVKNLHSYDTPEIIAIPISEGDQSYLDWIKEVTE